MSDLDRALLTAVNDHDLPKIKALVQAGANINYTDPLDDHQSLLATAIYTQVDLIRTLLDLGANPSPPSPSESGLPLIYAVWNLDYGLVRYLLECTQVDVNGVGFTTPGDAPMTALDAAYGEKHCRSSPGSALALDGIIALLKAHGGRCYHELAATAPSSSHPSM
jgi:hypothetical protein